MVFRCPDESVPDGFSPTSVIPIGNLGFFYLSTALIYHSIHAYYSKILLLIQFMLMIYNST
jgi:hypothetical protein